MSAKDFITRDLEGDGCKVVGNQIKTNAEELKGKGEQFSPKLDKSLGDLNQTTEEIANLLPSSITMVRVDRGSDRSVGAWKKLLLAIAATLHEVDFLELPLEAQVRAHQANTLLKITLPQGTGFLNEDFDIQWSNMDQLGRALDKTEAKALITALGLEWEVARLKQWIKLYGERKGITQPQQDLTKKLRALEDTWHVRYGKVIVQAFAQYDDENDIEQVKKREVFRTPYLAFVQKLRDAEQKYRDEQRKKKEEKKKTEGSS